MNPSEELPNSSEADFHLAQIDPPHPFKSAWKTFALAAVVLIVAVAIFYLIVRKPPETAGEIVQVNYYPVHSTISGGGDGTDGMQGGNESYDQLLVLAVVRVRNQTDIPIFLQDIAATVTTADGAKHENIGAGASDFDRVFQAFPSLASLRSQPFDRTATIAPGQSAEGLAIFNFPLTRQQWDQRKSGNVVVSFLHQRNLLIDFPR